MQLVDTWYLKVYIQVCWVAITAHVWADWRPVWKLKQMLRLRPVHRELKHLMHVQRWHWERTGGISTFPPRLPSALQSVLRMGDGRERTEGHVHSLDTCSCPPGQTSTAWSLSHTCKDWARVSHPHWQVGVLWASLSSLCLAGNGGLGWKVQEVPLPRLGLGVLVLPHWIAVSGRPAGFLPWCTGLSEGEYQLPGNLPPKSQHHFHHIMLSNQVARWFKGKEKTPHPGGRQGSLQTRSHLPPHTTPSSITVLVQRKELHYYFLCFFFFLFFLGEKTEGYRNEEII